MGKEELVERVQQHLALYPSDAADILEAVTVGLKKFEHAQRTARAKEAAMAVHMAICVQPIVKGTDPVGLVYMAFYHYPKGAGWRYSKVERDWWDNFLKLCAPRRSLLKDYLKNAEHHSPGIFQWWMEVVSPELGRLTPAVDPLTIESKE